MNLDNRNFFHFTHILTDFGIITCSFIIAIQIYNPHFGGFGFFELGFLVFLLCGWYFTARSNHLYDHKTKENLIRELFKTANALLWQVMLAILFIFVLKEKMYSRIFVLSYAVLLSFFLPLSKVILKRIHLLFYRHGYLRRRALVIGGGENGQLFCRYLRDNKFHGYELVRYVHGRLNLTSDEHSTFGMRNLMLDNKPLGDIEDIDEVFITEEPEALYNTREIASVLSTHAVRLRIIPNIFNLSNSGSYSFSMLGNIPLLSLRNEPLEDVYNRLVKRVFDASFSFLVLLFICSWLFPILALAIKLSSAGPVFYQQERWGKRNRRFICYKFRSMVAQAPETNPSGKFQQAKKGDARITAVGRFLRKTSLDEFPQFFNVLMGDMSVVGPRPHASLMNVESTHTVKNYLVRHQVNPGITGWAQVNGLRGELTDPKLLMARIEHDIWYIEHWTFVLDLKIMFLTFWKIIIGDKRAY